jgi:hypothetical protein
MYFAADALGVVVRSDMTGAKVTPWGAVNP